MKVPRKLNTGRLKEMCFYLLVKTHPPYWHPAGLFQYVCVATNEAMRFSCVASFEATHFYFEQEVETGMKKWIAMLLSLVMCLSLCACGGGGSEQKASSNGKLTEPPIDSKNQEIVLEEPITILDNETATVRIVRFFTEYHNEGRESEFAHSGFELEIENHLHGGYYIDLNFRDVSLSDNRVIQLATSRPSPVAEGKIDTWQFFRYDDEIFEDLNDLYDLNGTIELKVTKDKYFYDDLGGTFQFSFSNSVS